MTDQGMITFGDFTSLPGEFQYVAFVPQWDFLDFITSEAPVPGVHAAAAGGGVRSHRGGRCVRGVRYRTPEGPCELQALLTVGCDGRHSVVRSTDGLPATDFGAPMDVLWFRILRRDSDPSGPFLRMAPGRLLPMIDRRSCWQAAYVVPKGRVRAAEGKGDRGAARRGPGLPAVPGRPRSRPLLVALRLPLLRRLVSRFMAIGVRNEHVQTNRHCR